MLILWYCSILGTGQQVGGGVKAERLIQSLYEISGARRIFCAFNVTFHLMSTGSNGCIFTVYNIFIQFPWQNLVVDFLKIKIFDIKSKSL